jgi:hypothetical protein
VKSEWRDTFEFIFASPGSHDVGCGTLIIRDVAAWRQLDDHAAAGLALSVAENSSANSLAPMPWLGSTRVWTRLGVNWIYFLFMLAFRRLHNLVPVQIVDLIFPRAPQNRLRAAW